MQETSKALCTKIQGCKIAYTQSDEISLLLVDYDDIDTDAWFGNGIQKMASIAASMATLEFNKAFSDLVDIYYQYTDQYGDIGAIEVELLRRNYESKKWTALFDARVFSIPKDDVCNYFIWRQQDATRNSILMLAQSIFSHRQMQGQSCNQLQDIMFKEHGVNWNELPTTMKRGSCVIRKVMSYTTPEQYVILNFIKTMRNNGFIPKAKASTLLGMITTDFQSVKNYIAKEELLVDRFASYSVAESTTQRPQWVVDEEIPIFTQDRVYIERYI